MASRLGKSSWAAPLFTGLALAACVVHVVPGCSASPDQTTSTGTGGSSGLGGHGGSAGSGGGIFVGPGSGGAAGSTGTAIDPDAACAISEVDATLAPLDMFIAFDDSGSMAGPKWVHSRAAMIAFFQDPAAAGISIAFRFFGDETDPCQMCDVVSCSTPMVDIGTLTADPAPMDTQEDALVTLFTGHQPLGGTPLSAVVNGAEQWATNYKALHPDHAMVVLLVTDGEPATCDLNVNDIAAFAAAARASDGVLTFAVGLQGSHPATMNKIATAGGTGQAFFISNTNNSEQELLDALHQIQTDFACTFPFPTTDGKGHKTDPGKVNVQYVPGDGSPPVLFGEVADAAACGASGGWFYDDPAHPTTITLCPATCTELQGDPTGKVKVIIGCTTVPG
jgi:von Willebrand factor type A domain